MSLRYLILIMCLTLSCDMYSQETVVFRGRVVDARTGRPIRNLAIRLEGEGSARTDDDGLFDIAVGDDQIVVTLTVQDISWEFVNKAERTRPVPKHHIYRTEFALSPASLQDMQERIQQLRIDTARYRMQIKSLTQENAQIQTQLTQEGSNQQSLAGQIAQNDHLIDSLQSQLTLLNQHLLNYRGKLYEEISANYNQFLVAIRDFELEALSRIKEAFLYPGQSNGLRELIVPYNQAVVAMQDRHQSYIRDVETYWDKATADQLRRVYQLALIQIHEDIMFPLSATVFDPLEKVSQGQVPRVGTQRKAIKATKTALEALHDLIESLRLEAEGDQIRTGALPALQRP